jgi:hypothetical protein
MKQINKQREEGESVRMQTVYFKKKKEKKK